MPYTPPPWLLEYAVRAHERSGLLQRLTGPARSRARHRPATLRHGQVAGLQLAAATAALSLSFGNHEADLQKEVVESLEAGDAMLDIGGHVGLFSLAAARRVGPSGHVYAFEPEPGCAETIRRSAALNGFSQIEVIEKAAWSCSGHTALLVPQGQPLWALVVPPEDQTPGHVPIDLVTVDELVGEGRVSPPAAVKIDVQGGEVEVLRGMQDTLERYRPVVFCELHGTGAKVVPLLREAGYEVRTLDPSDDPDSPSWGAYLLARQPSPRI